ncbi:Aldose 1-epimerase [Nesidiocoris tenuis]|nr:Aldose 1-epimerase [Nesidiocoris tenuis]
MATEQIVNLKNGDAEATIYLHGATVTSWKIKGNEQLFVSEASKLDGSSHIMGGVPIVFPKFADWGGPDRPFHGFARITRWSLKNKSDNSATFELVDSELTRSYWNYQFKLEYTVNIDGNALRSCLSIQNPSKSENMPFEILYHTFIRVPDVRNITISGLKGLKYNDKTRNFDEFVENRDLVQIQGMTDSVYRSTPDVHLITNAVGGKTIELKKSGLPDLVVWNPWSEASKTFTDLKPYDWKDYVCTEAGSVVKQIVIGPGQNYVATQILTVL